MKYILLGFFLSGSAMADWCDIKDLESGKVLHTYLGKCSQNRFGGPWGDVEETAHVANLTKQAEEDAKNAAHEAKKTARSNRLQRIKGQCNGANGLLKELCDLVLDQHDML